MSLSRWHSVDGSDEACRSCDINHQVEETLPTQPLEAAVNTKAQLAVSSLESFAQNRPKHHPATYVRFHPGSHQDRDIEFQQSSAKLMKTGTNYKAREYNSKSVDVIRY